MRRFVLLLLLSTAPAMADDPPARVKVELSPKDGAWVGQRVTLAITLDTPDFFAGVPSFAIPTIPGTVVLPPAGSPVLGSETIGDTTFTTQRHEFAIYAQRAEIVRIPAFAIRFESNAGFGKPIIRRQVTTETVSFTAKTPPGADGLGTVIAARNLKVTDAWQPEPKTAKVGDAFTRTLTVTADDVPGMVFPSFQLDGIEGLAAYPKEPAVNDRTERGALTGRRVETITYVCEAVGTVAVPDRTLTWYDLDANELETAKVPGRNFTIGSVPKPDPTPDSATPAQARVTARGGPSPRSGSSSRFADGWPSGSGRGLCEPTRTGPSPSRRLSRDSAAPATPTTRTRRLWPCCGGSIGSDRCPSTTSRRTDDPELTGTIAALADRVYGQPDVHSGAWSGGQLFARIALARRRLRSSTTRPGAHSLPPLNPVG